MDDIAAMKGMGICTRSVSDGTSVIALFRYVDGSWGISRDGRPFAIWEPEEKELCMVAFAQFARRTMTGEMTSKLPFAAGVHEGGVDTFIADESGDRSNPTELKSAWKSLLHSHF